MWDDLKAAMGWWPYQCEACRRRFVAGRRYPPARASEAESAGREQRQAQAAGPEIAFRSDPVRPVAKIVVQADDHVQLDKILVALHRAVSAYQQGTSDSRAGKPPFVAV